MPVVAEPVQQVKMVLVGATLLCRPGLSPMSISTLPKNPVIPPAMVLQGTALPVSFFTSIQFYTTTLLLYPSAWCNTTAVITNIYMFKLYIHSISVIHTKARIIKR